MDSIPVPVSLEGEASQLVGCLVGAAPGERILHACAAPGGKTTQLAGVADNLMIDAVEVDAARAERIEANLRRTQVRGHALIRVHIADAARPEQYAAVLYQRILLDAPCTASGIVRRHPDIPWLRRVPADVAQLATLQARLLDALWPLLEPAGRLLYVVCSVFAEEGPRQAEAFAARHGDARPLALPGTNGAREYRPIHFVLTVLFG